MAEEQLSFEIEVLNLSEKHRVSGETSHQHINANNPTNLFDLPTEIVIEIFLKLSVKSLLKIKYVSKSWHALISSPRFIKYHLNLSANYNKYFTNHNVILNIAQPEFNLEDCFVMEESDLDYHMKNSGISFVIEGFINGLVCLVNKANEIFLWNPTIRKYKKLSNFRTQLKNEGYCIYGFGYDEIHDDYKVMCIFSIVGCPPHFQEVNIYSLKNDSWQIIHCSLNMIRLMGSGKFVNGKFYWTASVNIISGWSIASFNLINEKWRKMERPYNGEESEGLVLGVLGSNLSAMCNNSTTHVDVWVMEEYEDKECWIKMFTINCALNPVDYLFSHSFYLSKKGEFLLMFDDYVMIYDLKDNSIRYSQTSEFDYGLLTEFFQSLVCPLSENESRILQE
ncbi:hypothetical protein R3W88_020739 [Solanum pinnatisectum]|uniref:F-box domain-containing protein n=1 Tax=Solanum pinnatisectum TaxID=50273 RepID=A0AAV9KN74_9SOLN|nr:hypothetical protein R3W88_020739 [Solanum pinnatisectum]